MKYGQILTASGIEISFAHCGHEVHIPRLQITARRLQVGHHEVQVQFQRVGAGLFDVMRVANPITRRRCVQAADDRNRHGSLAARHMLQIGLRAAIVFPQFVEVRQRFRQGRRLQAASVSSRGCLDLLFEQRRQHRRGRACLPIVATRPVLPSTGKPTPRPGSAVSSPDSWWLCRRSWPPPFMDSHISPEGNRIRSRHVGPTRLSHVSTCHLSHAKRSTRESHRPLREVCQLCDRSRAACRRAGFDATDECVSRASGERPPNRASVGGVHPNGQHGSMRPTMAPLLPRNAIRNRVGECPENAS